MKRLVIIIACLVINELHISGQIIDLKDTIISCGSLCGLKIGDTIQNIISKNKGFNFIKLPVNKFGIDGEEDGVLVMHKKDSLFFLWSKNDSLFTIDGITILSKTIVTSKGIHVGSKIFDCVVKYSDFYLQRSFYHYWLEYYSIDEMNCKLNNLTYILEFYTDSNGTYGKYKSDSDEEEKTKSFITYRTTVDYIVIYN